MSKKAIPRSGASNGERMDIMRVKAAAAREERKAAGRSTRLTPVERSQADPRSRTKAIAAMCWDCQGGDADPCNPWRVGNCTIEACPLHWLRPHQKLQGTPTPKALLTQFTEE